MAFFNPLGAFTAFAGGVPKGISDQQDAQTKAYDLMGMQALGRAFQPVQGPIAPISPLGPQSQPPMPGQASQPSQPPMGPPPGPQAGAGGPSAAPPAAGPPQPAAGPMPPQMPPQGGGGMPGGGPPGMPPQQGPGGMPQLDLQTLAARIQKANPNLPPLAMVAALTRAVPLLNVQGRQDLAMLRLEMQQQIANAKLDQGDRRLDQGDRRIDRGDEKATEAKGEAKKIWEAMKRGDQPPTMTGLYRLAPEVRAAAAEDTSGASLAKMQQEWNRANKQILSLNGPQMIRYQGLAHSVVNTIDEVNRLAQEMENSGIPLLNRAKMAAYAQTQGNSPKGQLVARYMAGINTLKEEFANLAQGGYAPTEAAWGLANQQINGDYGVKQLGASLGEVQRLINYRIQAIPGIGTLGTDAPNRYVPGGTGSGGGGGEGGIVPGGGQIVGGGPVDPMAAAKQKLRDQMGGAPKVDLGGGWSAQRVQ